MEAWLGFPHQTLFRWRERKETHAAGGSFLNALEGHLQRVEEGSLDARVSRERCQKRFNVVRVRVRIWLRYKFIVRYKLAAQFKLKFILH